MIGDLLDLVDLSDKRETYVQGLSRGMQQRLCLAHTLVHDPPVLLLDEPASGPRPARAHRAPRAAPRAPLAGQDDPRSRPTSFPSSRSCAPRSRSSTAARCSPRAGSRTSSSGCAPARCSGSGCSPRARSSMTAAHLVRRPARRGVVAAARGRHDRARVPRRRRRDGRAARRRGPHGPLGRRRSRAPRATSRSCSSRSPRATRRSAIAGTGDGRGCRRMTAVVGRRRRFGALRDIGDRHRRASATRSCAAGCAARRAFLLLTFYLVRASPAFAWMLELIEEQDVGTGVQRRVLRLGADRPGGVHRR